MPATTLKHFQNTHTLKNKTIVVDVWNVPLGFSPLFVCVVLFFSVCVCVYVCVCVCVCVCERERELAGALKVGEITPVVM